MTINLKNHHKTYLSAAVFSIGILVTVFFIVLPLISQINKSSKELVEDRLTTETFFANWRNLQTTQQEIEEIKNGNIGIGTAAGANRTIKKGSSDSQTPKLIKILSNIHNLYY